MKYFLNIYKNTLSLLLLLLFTCGLSSCMWFENRKNAEIDLTVLIYLAANNNLRGNAIKNLKDLKAGYVPDYSKPGDPGAFLLVYYHISGEPPQLLRISKDEHGEVNEEIIREYDLKQNSGDVSTLKEVLEYTSHLFPSEDNGLILWSHGTGWLPRGFYSNPVSSSIGADGQRRQMSLPVIDDPMRHLVKSFGNDYGSGGKEMEIQDLAEALPIKYSFILFDACLMAGVEVAYEIKDKADYVISSTAEILTGGFPYDKIMTHIFAGKDAESGLSLVCDDYVNYYSSKASQTSRSATISLVKTSELEGLAAASAVIFNKDRENVDTLTTNRIQRYFRYSHRWYYDLDDYIRNISSDSRDYTKFHSALESAVIYKRATPYFFFNGTFFEGDGFSIDHFSGLSTYIPKPSNLYLEKYYKSLLWNVDAQMIK